MTPVVVHTQQATAVHAARAQVLATAHAAHPDRFLRGIPQPPRLPTAAWINKPLTLEVAP